jgi:predicted ATPase/DNA-binding XRE family transcriptional regulator
MEDEGREYGSSDFGRLLKHYRLAAGLSQQALADRARLSLDGISALERGHRRSPQRKTLALLAGALAISDEQRRAFESAATRSSSPRHRERTTVTVGPWPIAGSTTLPLALTSFVGREAELDEIAALVGENRMVTLTGPGGIGKTQTALQVGTALCRAYDKAVCFVGLAPIGNPSLVVRAIASGLGVQEVPNRPVLEIVLAYLQNKALLLILDNCEHVIARAGFVAEALLAACPRVRILATSREPLRAAGEYTYRLPSLRVPSSEAARDICATDAAVYGAVALFTDRARAVEHRFALTNENASIVVALCRRLDGIPLAIELAAARVSLFSLEGLAERLNDRFRILAGGARAALPRQQTMRATIDWSYDLLSAPERRLFERLSVFAGTCTLATATAVCVGDDVAEADLLDLLSSLIDKSLVVAALEGTEPRYRLLESFRQYAHERLMTRGEDQITARRHALAFLELAEWISCNEVTAFPERQRRWAPDRDNWRAAVQWALTDHGDVRLGQQLAGALSWWASFYYVEGREWIAVALELVDERTPRGVLAALYIAQASIAELLKDYKVELSSSYTALAHYRILGETVGIGCALGFVAHALFCLGQRAEAQSLLEEAVPRARGLEGPARSVLAHILRLTARTQGDIIEARRHIGEAMQIYEALGLTTYLAYSLNDLGYCEFSASNVELALRHATEALAIARQCHDVNAQSAALNDKSIYLISLARHDEPSKCARGALRLALKSRLDVQITWALEHLAVTACLRPEVPTEQSCRASAIAARILGFVDVRLAALASARYEWVQPQHDQALAALHDALGTDAVASLLAEGARMTENQAVEAALAI